MAEGKEAKKNGSSWWYLASGQDKETCRFLGTRGHEKGIFFQLSNEHQNIPEDIFQALARDLMEQQRHTRVEVKSSN